MQKFVVVPRWMVFAGVFVLVAAAAVIVGLVAIRTAPVAPAVTPIVTIPATPTPILTTPAATTQSPAVTQTPTPESTELPKPPSQPPKATRPVFQDLNPGWQEIAQWPKEVGGKSLAIGASPSQWTECTSKPKARAFFNIDAQQSKSVQVTYYVKSSEWVGDNLVWRFFKATSSGALQFKLDFQGVGEIVTKASYNGQWTAEITKAAPIPEGVCSTELEGD